MGVPPGPQKFNLALEGIAPRLTNYWEKRKIAQKSKYYFGRGQISKNPVLCDEKRITPPSAP